MLLTEDWVKSLNLDDSLAREALSHGVSTCLQWQVGNGQRYQILSGWCV